MRVSGAASGAPPVTRNEGEDMERTALERLSAVIDKLTGPGGCPWDKEQTPESLADYVVEESHELAEAIRSGKVEDVREEMGDVAFLLLFLARLYESRGSFTLADALDDNAAKMVRRHPHVFAQTSFENREEQLRAWESVKRSEKQPSGSTPAGVFDSLPKGLPPLIKAYRIHSKAARAGFTWTEDQEAEQQAEAEWLEWLDASAGKDKEAQTHELGDMIFTLVELGRRKGIKANEALDYAAMRFLERFQGMEALARERGLDFLSLSLDEKDELWNEVKAAQEARTG